MTVTIDRALAPLSIIDVLDDDQLLGAALQHPETFAAWRVFLRSIFGLPIDPDDMPLFTAATGRTVAPTKRATEAYAIVSRRGRKTLMLSGVAVYLAAFQDWRGALGRGELHGLARVRRRRRGPRQGGEDADREPSRRSHHARSSLVAARGRRRRAQVR